MNIFRRNKNLYQAPPSPPKRPDKGEEGTSYQKKEVPLSQDGDLLRAQQHVGSLQSVSIHTSCRVIQLSGGGYQVLGTTYKTKDHAHGDAEDEAAEDEGEDQYTYEVPPSEGQSKTVTPAKEQDIFESAYLDHLTVRRFSEPNNLLQPKHRMFPPQPGQPDTSEQTTSCFLELEKVLQKGMMKSIAPLPSARRVSLPALAPSVQAKIVTNQDSFLEPIHDKEDCKEESIYLECEPSPVTSRVLPCRIPVLPALPKQLNRKRCILPGSQPDSTENSSEGGCLTSRSMPEEPGLQDKAWYAGSCDRRTAEVALLQFNKDSAYMVRQSSGHARNQPYTLVVLYKNHIYNIPIRYLEGSGQYTLGKDGKSHEEFFDSISRIIQNYMEKPLVLINSSTASREQTCLSFPVKP